MRIHAWQFAVAVFAIAVQSNILATFAGDAAKVAVVPSATSAAATRANALLSDSDPPSKQVLIECAIARVESYKRQTQAEGSILLQPSNGGLTINKGGTKLELRIKDSSIPKFLQSFENVADIQVVAAPRLLVLDKQRAEIHQTVNLSGNDLRLRLRPFVLSSEMVRLEVHLERQFVEGTKTEDQQVTTNVEVQNGRTLAIGGLTQLEPASTADGSRPADALSRKELIVLLTPRIWSEKSHLRTEIIHPVSDWQVKNEVQETVRPRLASKSKD